MKIDIHVDKKYSVITTKTKTGISISLEEKTIDGVSESLVIEKKATKKDSKDCVKSLTSSGIHIYTDGGCSPNPGNGGWGAVIEKDGKIEEISGFQEDTTNNQMELTATIESLKRFKEKSSINIYTDSIYVKNGITSWILSWQKNNWKTANGKSVKNQDLWQKLWEKAQFHDVKWNWIKGHSNHPQNERADFLATEEIKNNK